VEGQQARMRVFAHLQAMQHNACKPECFLSRRHSPSTPGCRVSHTRRVQLLMVPLRISCARCHLLGPALRHAAVASLLCGCCISMRPLLLQCLQALRSSSFKTRPAPSALRDPLVASYSLFSQRLGPASRFSLTEATGPLRHTTRVDTIPCQGTGSHYSY
jgi:hypothetical protein